VVDLARRGEGAGDRDEDYLLVLELGTGVELRGMAAGEDIAGLGGGLDVEEGDILGEGVSGFEGRHFR